MDKNQAIIDYMLTCPQIANNPTFFNCIQAQDNNKEIVTIANDRMLNKPYIDGSVLKRYSYTIIDFRSVTFNPLVNALGYSNENVEDMLDVQGIVDWIEEQNDIRNFPDFGTDCVVDEIVTTSDTPNLNGVDNSLSPSLAKYSITVNVNYLDNTKKLF